MLRTAFANQVLCGLDELIKTNHELAMDDKQFLLSLDQENCFGSDRLAMRFKDPMGVHEQLVPQVLTAIGLRLPIREIDVLCPILVDIDLGDRSPEKSAERLFKYVALARSGALSQRFPSLTNLPALLVVTKRPERTHELATALIGMARKQAVLDDHLPQLYISDEQTMSSGGLTEPVWLSAFENKLTALLNLLLASAKSSGRGLTSGSHLVYQDSGERPRGSIKR